MVELLNPPFFSVENIFFHLRALSLLAFLYFFFLSFFLVDGREEGKGATYAPRPQLMQREVPLASSSVKPAGQSWQRRFLSALGDCTSSLPTEHTVSGRHWRLVVSVGATLSYLGLVWFGLVWFFFFFFSEEGRKKKGF
jgi:hypothetical protein